MRVPQRLFNPLLVKNECKKEKNWVLKKSFYNWRNDLYRNGFLYKDFKVNKLLLEKVYPALEEVQKF